MFVLYFYKGVWYNKQKEFDNEAKERYKMNRELLEQRMAELPLYIYDFIDPAELEFSDRIRWICENECPMYGKSWACPPGVGSVEHCKGNVIPLKIVCSLAPL